MFSGRICPKSQLVVMLGLRISFSSLPLVLCALPSSLEVSLTSLLLHAWNRHCGFIFSFFCSKVRMLRSSHTSIRSSHQHLRIIAVPPGSVSRTTSVMATGLSAQPCALLKGWIQNRSTPGGTLVMLLCLRFIRFSVSSINQCLASAHTLGSGENTQRTDIKLGES